MADINPASPPHPALRQRAETLDAAVAYWLPRLRADLAAAEHPGASAPRLGNELRAVLTPLYQAGDLRRPEVCPVQTPAAWPKTLDALEQVAGLPPDRVNALALRILDHGRRVLGWKLPAGLTTTLRLPRELPVLVADDFVGLTALQALEQARAMGIGSLAGWDRDARAGHVLHLAIVYGGLLRKELLAGLLPATREHLSITGYGSWLSLPLPAQGIKIDADSNDHPDELRVRWLLRPELELALLRFWQDRPAESIGGGKPPWRLLRAFYTATGLAAPRQPPSLAALRRWARARLALRLPPVLTAVMTGQLRSTPLPDSAHRRLCTGESVWRPDDTLSAAEHAAVAAAVLPSPSKSVTLTAEDRALRRAFRHLADKRASVREVRERVAEALVAEATKLSTVGRLLGAWVLHLLSHQTKRRRLATVRRYVQPVRRYALPELRSADPDTYTDDQWEARLQDAIDQARDSMAPLAIYLFVRFISAQPDGPNIDPDELEGIESVSRVRANLLSVADFERAMQQLQAPTHRERRMAQLVGALGFYMGLRRGEALHLRIGDISGRRQPHLLVRGNRHHRLKRFTSQRVLPLFALLPPNWLAALIGWVELRDAEGRSRSRDRLLFCAPGKQFTPLAAEALITPVRDAIRAATADHGLVYHHLRHSFANWTLLRLLAPELPLGRWRETFAALDHPWFEGAHCRLLREAVLGGRNPDLPVRHAAYALARLMGHGAVATTWRAYIHLADLAAFGVETRDRPLALPDSEVQVLLGIGKPGGPADSAYHRWRRLYRKAWSTELAGLDAGIVLDRARRDTLGYDDGWERTPSASTSGVVDAVVAEARGLQLDDVPALLGALFRDRRTVQQVAARSGVDPRRIDRLKAAAVDLAEARTTATGKRRFRIPPQPPSGQADGDALAVVLARVEQGDMDWQPVRAGIDLLRRADPSRGHRILLNDPHDACRFVAMLNALGFPRETLRAELYPRPEDAAANLAFWADQLGIDPLAFTCKAKRVSRQAVHGCIAIGVTSPRRYSRHGLDEGGDAVAPYDPARAGRALPLLVAASIDHDVAWQLQDAEAAATLGWLLYWLGFGRERIDVDADAARVAVRPVRRLEQATVRHACTVLAAAKPYHDLRMVSADMGDITAAVSLLRAGGVDPRLLHIDLTGEWTQQARDDARKVLIEKALIERLRLGENQIELKRRKRPARLSLSVKLPRGSERIKAWSLTYALIMVYLHLAAVGDSSPQAGGMVRRRAGPKRARTPRSADPPPAAAP
jgi:hypothetical protein